MAEDKKVEFSAKDNGIGSFMDNMRKKAKAMFEEQLNGAKKVSAEYKDWTKSLKDFITELQRKQRIENEARKQKIRDAENFGGEKERDWAQSEKEKMRQEAGQDKMTNEYLKQLLEQFKKDTPNDPGKKGSVFNDILRAGLLRDFAAMVKQIPNSRNGLEVIPGFGGIAGAGAGAAIGLPFASSAAGAQIGKSIGEFFGQAMMRHLTEQSRFSGTVGRLRGIGANANDLNLTEFGLDMNEAGSLKESLVRAIGFDPKEKLRTTVAEIKAFTLEEGIASNYLSTRRLGSGIVSMNSLARTGMNQGVEKVDIERLITNQTQLTNLVAQSVVSPNSFGVAKSIFDFNKVGGPFSVSDPRSMELLSTIHGNIVNPSSPFGQAQNYSVLRRLNPQAGLVDLMMQGQRGIENRDLTSGILEDITKMGGSEDFQTLMVANRLGLNNNIGAARMLLQNRSKIGSMTDEDFTSFSQENIEKMASENVPMLEKNQAVITNAFITSMSEGILTVSEKFKDSMALASEEAAKDIVNRFKNAFGSSDPKPKGPRTVN